MRRSNPAGAACTYVSTRGHPPPARTGLGAVTVLEGEFFFLLTINASLMSSKGWIFSAGVLALGLSLYLWFSGSKQAGIFVGLWVPSLWILADLVANTEPTGQ